MPSKSPNDVGYDDRLKFVDDLFNHTFKIAPLKIDVIAYDSECPFPYNNFVFVVTIESLADAANMLGEQPGTVPIPPSGLQKFAVRLPNSQAFYNHKTRVENEVIALQIARQALKASPLPEIVPRVFAWGSAAGGQQGWMLQEYMQGVPLSQDFPNLGLDDQRRILEQMADILKAFQQYKMPASIHGYGGLTFDNAGNPVIGPMSIMDCGPFDTYAELVLGTIRDQLAKADENKMVQGWTNGNIRARLEKFLGSGLQTLMKEFTEDSQKLVHADHTTDNLLYNPTELRVTGLLDFDFSHIGTIADDFFRSLGRGIGRFPDPREGEEILPLNKAMLSNFPYPLPQSTEEIQWQQAEMWDAALRERSMHRPGNIRGIEALSSLFWLSAQLLPFKLSWDFIIDNSDKDIVQGWKTSGEKLLDEFLKDQGC